MPTADNLAVSNINISHENVLGETVTHLNLAFKMFKSHTAYIKTAENHMHLL